MTFVLPQLLMLSSIQLDFYFIVTVVTEERLEALSEWSDTLKSFGQKLGKHFARSEARQAAFDYIQALLSPVERKNGWQMAEQVGYSNPYRLQHLLGRAQWDADAVCADVRQYAVEH
jgi:SRSO17 transposase